VAASTLDNAGTLVAQPGTTRLTGDFRQAATAAYTFAFDGVSNHTLAVGGTATLGGTVVPVVGTTLLPFTDTGLAAGSLADVSAIGPRTLLFGWAIQAAGNAVTVAPTVGFTPAGVALDASQSSLAGYLGRAWSNADPSFAGRFAALYNNVSTGAAYTAALDQYSPRGIQGPAMAMLNGAGAVLGASMSCPRFEGAGTLLGEGRCLWARGGGQVTQQHRDGGKVSGATYRVGGQMEFAPGWFFGGSIAGGTVWAEAGGGSKSSGESYDGSAAVKHLAGPWMVGASLAVGGGAYRNSRAVSPPGGGGGVARSDSNALLVGGRLRAANDVAFERWYLRPFLDLDIYHLRTPDFTESGGGGNALRVRASGTTRAAVSPMLEIGARHDLGASTVLRWYLDLGASFLPGTSREVRASFVGASPADGTFATILESPAVTANLDLGLQLYKVGGWELRAECNLRAASAFLSQGGSLRVGHQF
jgi:hypothetical protein